MKEFEELKQNLEKLNNELNTEKEKYDKLQINLKENNDKLNDKIKEGNEIEIKFDEIKNERNILIEQLFGNTNKNIVLENREKLSISGVLDVLSFDDQIVILETDLGMLTVKGDNLKINKLSIDTADVIIEGEINTLSYSQKDLERRNEGIFSKIFK